MNRIVKDIVHGDIYFDDLEKEIIDTDYIQRLKYVKQNGLGYLVYPSLNNSRFEHSLGVMHLSTRILDQVLANSKNANDFIASISNDLRDFKIDTGTMKPVLFVKRLLRVVALVHDVGHFPLSHATEFSFGKMLRLDKVWLNFIYPNFDKKPHELLTLGVANDTNLIADKNLRRAVSLVLLSDHKTLEIFHDIVPKFQKFFSRLQRSFFYTIKKIVSSALDADRGDYLLRDGKISGSGFGSYDTDRFLSTLRITFDGSNDRYLVGISNKGLSVIESFLIGRFQLYKNVYLHRKVKMFNKIVDLLIENLSLPNTTYPSNPIDPERYLNKLASYLMYGKRREKILRCGNSYIDPSFLVHAPGGKYLDDIWLLNKIRRRKKTSSGMMVGHLDRKKSFKFLWKDIEEMREVMDYIIEDDSFVKRLTKLSGLSIKAKKKNFSLLPNLLFCNFKKVSIYKWFSETAKRYGHTLLWHTLHPRDFLINFDDVLIVDDDEVYLGKYEPPPILNGICKTRETFRYYERTEPLVWLSFSIPVSATKTKINEKRMRVKEHISKTFKSLCYTNKDFRDCVVASLDQ
ncbi:MAG: hypothetical protein WBB67_00250 [bacterium]